LNPFSNPSYLLPPLVTFAINLILVAIVWRGSRRSFRSVIFICFLLSVGISSFLIFGMRASPTVHQATMWERPAAIVGFAIFLLYYHFTLTYTNTRGQRPILHSAYLFLALPVVLAPTNLLVESMRVEAYGYAPVLGPLGYPLVVSFFPLVVGGTYNLLRRYRTLSSYEEKNRMLYLAIAASFPLAGGFVDAFTNLPPVAIWSNLIFCIVCTIAVVKYHLLDIRIIVRRSLTYLLVSIVIAVPYISILLLLNQILRTRMEPWWVHAIIVLLLAILLRPLYSRAQHMVDRLFYQDRYDYLRALEQFSQKTQSVENLKELGSTLTQLVSGALRTSSACLLLPSESDNGLIVVSSTGPGSPPSGVVLRNSSPLIKWLKLQQRILSSEEFHIVPQLQSLSISEQNNLKQMEAKLFVPIQTGPAQLSGILVLGQKLSQQPYSSEDRQLLIAMSSQMAMSLENARLYNESKQEVEERRRAEESLKESEQRYRALFEGTLDGAFVIDAETMKVVLANKATAMIFGFDSAEDIVGVSPLDFVPPDDRDRVIQIVAEDMFAKDLRQVNEFRTITRDSREIWIRAIGVRTEYQGRLAGLVSFWDTTERKRAEEALKESEEKYRSLVSNISLGIFRSTPGPRGKFLEVNPAMERITGYSRKELLQMDVSDLYRHPEERETVLEEIVSAMGMTTRELRFRKKDGIEIIVSDTKVAVRNDSGQIMYFDGILEDITEHRRAEEELQRIEKLESIGILAGGIAHDFNNILTGILGNITLAKRYVEPESNATDRLLEAEKASIKAKDLTQQLLTFSRGGAPIKKTASIAELIQDSVNFALRGSKVRCEFSLPDDLWPVEVDEGQISQVITNLVINADEAMPGGGTIDIGTENTVVKGKGALLLPKGNYIKITVKDHGIGIPQEHLGKIFDPYFTTKQKGSGLGLATAYSIIKNHDGHITVESELGVGTTFCIYLPASQKPVPVKKRVKKEGAPARGKGRILVMDDEEIIREMLNKMLPLAGYEVELTSDGAEAIKQYAKAMESGQPFDAVIMDLTIPGGIGGREAIKKLLEIDPDAKVIVSSGYATDPIMADFKKYGFSAVVTKPYSVGELEKTLRNMLTE